MGGAGDVAVPYFITDVVWKPSRTRHTPGAGPSPSVTDPYHNNAIAHLQPVHINTNGDASALFHPVVNPVTF